MRLLLRIIAGLVAALVIGVAVVVGLFVFTVRSIFGPLAPPAPTPWSDPSPVPAAFAGPVPAGIAVEAPSCPEGGLRPVRRPNPVGQMVGVVLVPWYAIPAMFGRDELLGQPTASVAVRVVDPVDGRPVEGAQIAAIRADSGRFVQQFEGGLLSGLPVGPYRLRAATSTAPIRWGEATVEVGPAASGEVEIRLDRVAPDLAPAPLDAAPPAGGRIRLAWTGRTMADGLAVVARVGATGDRTQYTRVRGADGGVTVQASAAPGQHVASYLLCAPMVRTARWLVDVGPSDARVPLPERIRGGDAVALKVEGSFASPGRFAVAEAGGDRRPIKSGFAAVGETIAFVAPLSGGRFELVLDGDDAPLLTTAFTVEPVGATVLAPKTVRFREPVALGWKTEVPARLRLEVRPFTMAGWPGFDPTDIVEQPGPIEARWRLPPGKSQLRLVHLDQSDYPVAEAIVEVTDGPAFVAPPSSASAGATVTVGLTVPAAAGDRVAIVPRGYTTLDGAIVATLDAGARQASLAVPAAAGEFDLVYAAVEGTTRRGEAAVLSARTPLRVEP